MKKLAGTSLLLFIISGFIQNSMGQIKQVQKRNKNLSDSILAKIDYDKKNDSTSYYRNQNGFRYMDNLDSILRIRQLNKSQEITKGTNNKISKSSDYSAINKFLSSKSVTLFLWMLVILFVLFIIYKLVYKGGFFNNWQRRKSSQENISDKDDDTSHFEKQLIRTENGKMYNEAVRLLFLITLNEMSDKRLLHFSADKTNKDYLQELKDPIINREFAALIKTFEYCWYGKFNISEDRYNIIKKRFNEFNNKI
ncbi:MAG: hypothetical protein ABIR31_03605 [Ginsengibacter sp.]